MCEFELFSPASRQRSERGQELIAATFFLSPSILLYTHQSSSSSSVAAEPLLYSACLNKQELTNKRLPTCYSCPPNYQQAMKGKTSIQLNTDTNPLCVCVCAHPLMQTFEPWCFKALFQRHLQFERATEANELLCVCLHVCGWEARDFLILRAGCSAGSLAPKAL